MTDNEKNITEENENRNDDKNETGDDKLMIDVGSEVLAPKKWGNRVIWMESHVTELNETTLDVTFADSTTGSAIDIASAHWGGFTTGDRVKLLQQNQVISSSNIFYKIVKIHSDPLSYDLREEDGNIMAKVSPSSV